MSPDRAAQGFAGERDRGAAARGRLAAGARCGCGLGARGWRSSARARVDQRAAPVSLAGGRVRRAARARGAAARGGPPGAACVSSRCWPCCSRPWRSTRVRASSATGRSTWPWPGTWLRDGRRGSARRSARHWSGSLSLREGELSEGREALVGPDGRQDFHHFWLYSLVVAPVALGGEGCGRTTPRRVHADERPAAAARGLRRAPSARARARALVLFGGPLLWWLDKPHAEVFLVALLSVALVSAASRPELALPLVGLAAAQNPVFVPLLAVGSAWALLRRRTGRPLPGRWPSRSRGRSRSRIRSTTSGTSDPRCPCATPCCDTCRTWPSCGRCSSTRTSGCCRPGRRSASRPHGPSCSPCARAGPAGRGGSWPPSRSPSARCSSSSRSRVTSTTAARAG